MDLQSTPGTLPIMPLGVDLYGTLGKTGRLTPVEAAREAETMFLSLLLKEMRQSFESEESLFAGDKGDIYGGLFDLLMARHLAESGGLGLATVWGQLLEQTNQPNDARTPPTLSEPSSP
jgi:Rod binding domain-containing protein